MDEIDSVVLIGMPFGLFPLTIHCYGVLQVGLEGVKGGH